MSPTASFKKRYSFKLLTNIVGMGVGLVTQAIVPRVLGPASYGNYSFLTDYFWQLIGFLNLNSSTALYTKLCQRPNEKSLVRVYACFSIIIGSVALLFILFSYLSGFSQILWPEQAMSFIILAFVLAYFRYCNDTLISISDAFGWTIKSELSNVIQRIFSLILVLLLFFLHLLNLGSYLILQIATLSLSITLLIFIVNKKRIFFESWHLQWLQVRGYIKEFWVFCAPLFIFSAVSVLTVIFDRWLLQKSAGSIEQGYYGLGYQIGAVSLLVTSAMIPLVFREYAVSLGKGDNAEFKRVLLRYLPMLYSISAYFGCFLAVESKSVIRLFGGNAYSQAIFPVSLMCLYPIHQTLGQLNASVYFAAHRTDIYRNIGIGCSVVGLFMSLLLLGPKEYGGFEAGANGLSIKMILIQFISVNIQLFYITRIWGIKRSRLVIHQIVVPILFLSGAYACSYVSYTLAGDLPFIIPFFVSGIMYTASIILLAILFPTIFSVSRGEMFGLMSGVKKVLTRYRC